MNEILALADLEFEVRRSLRRKTLGLTVDRAGELVVHVPASTDADEVRQWVQKKLLWVHQKLALKDELVGTEQHPEFVSGESFFYLGRNYRLKVVTSQDTPLRFDGQWFYLRRKDRGAALGHFRQWYVDTGSPWLAKRVQTLQRKVGTAPARVSVSDLGFRWGSCGKSGVLHFNWRLLQLPVRLVDYVIVHELVHLLERNHTKKFRQIMDRVLPDWQRRDAQLDGGWRAYVAFGIEEGRGRRI